jgi:hypothetical protein
VVPDQEVQFLSEYLFAGADGKAVADRIDRRVDSLPGLNGLHLLAEPSRWPRSAWTDHPGARYE